MRARTVEKPFTNCVWNDSLPLVVRKIGRSEDWENASGDEMMKRILTITDRSRGIGLLRNALEQILTRKVRV
jgi:hypothetical protein